MKKITTDYIVINEYLTVKRKAIKYINHVAGFTTVKIKKNSFTFPDHEKVIFDKVNKLLQFELLEDDKKS